jgi:hypothetical protein
VPAALEAMNRPAVLLPKPLKNAKNALVLTNKVQRSQGGSVILTLENLSRK